MFIFADPSPSQVLPESRQHEFDFHILDATRVWPVEEVPLGDIGELVLNKVVDEYFPETEQVAFCTRFVLSNLSVSDLALTIIVTSVTLCRVLGSATTLC